MKRLIKNKNTYIVLGGIILSLFCYWVGANVVFRSPIIVTVKLQTPAVWRYLPTTPTPKAPRIAPSKHISPTPKKVSTLQEVKKYLTVSADKTRTRGLAYLSKYYQGDELTAIDNIIKNESGWRVDAMNEIGAGGLPQALPYTKMNCPLDESGVECQLQWMIGYLNQRYGSPLVAWNFWQEHAWY